MTKSKRPPTPNLRDFKKIADVDPRKILLQIWILRTSVFLYTALAILVIIVLIIAVIYIGRHSQGGLLGNPSASSSATGDGEEQNGQKLSLWKRSRTRMMQLIQPQHMHLTYRRREGGLLPCL